MPARARPAASDRGPAGAAAYAYSTSVAGDLVGGRYVLGRRLRATASGEVWRAADAIGEAAAVKLAFEPSQRLRLRAESEVLHGCAHSAILRRLAFVETPAHAALVTEYLAGGDLVSAAGAAPRHWVRAALDVLDALDYLHGHGLVHRDVKARNVMLDAAARARLVDFGSAARIGTPRQAGGTTPAHCYAADGEVAAADDVYAFAVLVYELLAGRLPFGVVPQAHMGPPSPALPAGADGGARALERLVLRTLKARGGGDPGSMSAYRDVLESMAEESDRK